MSSLMDKLKALMPEENHKELEELFTGLIEGDEVMPGVFAVKYITVEDIAWAQARRVNPYGDDDEDEVEWEANTLVEKNNLMDYSKTAKIEEWIREYVENSRLTSDIAEAIAEKYGKELFDVYSG